MRTCHDADGHPLHQPEAFEIPCPPTVEHQPSTGLPAPAPASPHPNAGETHDPDDSPDDCPGYGFGV